MATSRERGTRRKNLCNDYYFSFLYLILGTSTIQGNPWQKKKSERSSDVIAVKGNVIYIRKNYFKEFALRNTTINAVILLLSYVLM